jgi:dTDP-4-dehydrorhamnose 3,5-epimerase
MRFYETRLQGALLVALIPFEDERGSFSRQFCRREFADRGLVSDFVQHSSSRSKHVGTLRGMHFQRPPYTEAKLVSCRQGAIWDVIVDLRAGSPTYRQWQGFELTAENQLELYIPKGFAHGFQSLRDDTEVSYLISEYYVPSASDGIRYDDPAFPIDWPLSIAVISQKDRDWPLFSDSRSLGY